MRRLLTMLLIIPFFAIAQNKYGNIWVTGAGKPYKISFSPTFSIDYFDSTFSGYCFANGATISDTSGNLLLCTNGFNIFNYKKNVIPNGDSICSSNYNIYYNNCNVSFQSSIFLPFDSNIIYEINPAVSDTEWVNWFIPFKGARFDILYAHKIDMNANNGDGAVIQKKITILQGPKLSKSGMTACRHANGVDWWLVKQGSDSNILYSFLVQKDTILGPFIQKFTEPHYTVYDRSGQSKFSQDGTRFANNNEQPNKVFVANFDRCHGTFSNPKVFNIPELQNDTASADTTKDRLPRGLEFSPNGKYLYVIMATKIFQLEIDEPDSSLAWVWVADKDTPVVFSQYSSSDLGPDGKLYIGYWSGVAEDNWSTIDNPNNKGIACNFCKKCITFPWFNTKSPPNMPNYNLGASADSCWPLSIPIIEKKENEFLVYPNPTFNNFNMHIESNINFNFNIEIYNAQGILVQTITQKKGIINIAVDASGWPRGVYFVRVGGQSKKVIIN